MGLITEVTVTLGLRTTAAACLAAATLAAPGLAEAQRHVAVPRPIPAHPVGGGGVYHAPVIHHPYYASPYWYGAYYGYGYPFYFSVGWGCCGYWPYAYGYPYYPYGYPYDPTAAMRLQVTPRETEVFVDGYYAGTVDDFDGTFQRLHLGPGQHDLELYLQGHRSYQQKVYLQPGKTFSVKHQMDALGPGDAEPVRPAGRPPREGAPQSRSSQRQPPIDPRDREAERRGPQSQSEFGSIALRVQPADASITIDGESWESSGDSDRLVVQLGPGVHHVQIRKDGFRGYMTDITIRPGETTALNVAMTPNRQE